MQHITIVIVVLIGAGSLITTRTRAQDASPAIDTTSSIVVEWPAAEGGELQLVVLDGDGAQRTVEHEAGRERLVLGPEDLHGRWSVCVTNPTDLPVEFQVTVSIRGQSRIVTGTREPGVSLPCAPGSRAFVTGLTLDTPHASVTPRTTPTRTSSPPPSATAPAGEIDLSSTPGSAAHLAFHRPDTSGHARPTEVSLIAHGERRVCTAPCGASVDPGTVRVRAGYAEREFDLRPGAAESLTIDPGWDDAAHGFYVFSNVSCAIGGLTAIVSFVVALVLDDRALFATIAGGALLVVGAPGAIIGAASAPNGSIRTASELRASLGAGGLRVQW